MRYFDMFWLQCYYSMTLWVKFCVWQVLSYARADPLLFPQGRRVSQTLPLFGVLLVWPQVWYNLVIAPEICSFCYSLPLIPNLSYHPVILRSIEGFALPACGLVKLSSTLLAMDSVCRRLSFPKWGGCWQFREDYLCFFWVIETHLAVVWSMLQAFLPRHNCWWTLGQSSGRETYCKLQALWRFLKMKENTSPTRP